MINNLKTLADFFLKSKQNNDKSYRKDFVYSKHNDVLKKIFNSSDDKLFEKLILADKAEMAKYIIIYKTYLKTNGHEFQSIEKLQKEKKNKKVFKALMTLCNTYENFSIKWNNQVVDAVGIRTCLYCNREYIITQLSHIDSSKNTN